MWRSLSSLADKASHYTRKQYDLEYLLLETALGLDSTPPQPNDGLRAIFGRALEPKISRCKNSVAINTPTLASNTCTHPYKRPSFASTSHSPNASRIMWSQSGPNSTFRNATR